MTALAGCKISGRASHPCMLDRSTANLVVHVLPLECRMPVQLAQLQSAGLERLEPGLPRRGGPRLAHRRFRELEKVRESSRRLEKVRESSRNLLLGRKRLETIRGWRRLEEVREG